MKKLFLPKLFMTMLLVVAPSCSQTGANCEPLETVPPNAASQKPTFKQQTRGCKTITKTAFNVTVLATGLNKPWAVEPLPEGGFLITEKAGTMRIIAVDGKIGDPIKGILAVEQGGTTDASNLGGLPPMTARGQGGLLDVALSPNFKTDSTIFWSFSEIRENGSGTSVARGKLNGDRTSVEDVKVIFRAVPGYENGLHFGSRLEFSKDGKLFITTGDRFDRPNRELVQRLDNHYGKVMRVNSDGSIPKDNPYINTPGAKPEIWEQGHRNIQSAALDANGNLWTVEHGPKGGDELNLIEKGKNYGWSIVSFGEEYSGEPIPNSVTQREGFVDPVYYWDPVIAPSGMEIYNGDKFPEWKGNIFIGGLASKRLVRLALKDNKVIGEEHLLTERGKRIRDVKQGFDGNLYVVTDEQNGELIKISPKANSN
ncbi:MAG: PQQ-dependent sugar dehydrogenase [Pyrinomonadaceae bacterium]